MDEIQRRIVTITHNANPESAKKLEKTYLLGFQHGYNEAIIQIEEMIESLDIKRNELNESWYSRLKNRKTIKRYERDIEHLAYARRLLRIFKDMNLTYVKNRIFIENTHPVISLNTNKDDKEGA